jgi:CheY-like chemotaxis protein
MVAELAARKKIQLTTSIAPGVSLIRGDNRRLRQVLINLLSNAIKFTPAGGSVGLEVQGAPDDEVARITVWDTGVGIAAEDARRLFQPFVQIAGEHQRDQRGSGLGLALVAQLIAMHGGGISLASEVGQGSRFTVALPWSPAHEQAMLTQLPLPQEAGAEIDTVGPLVAPVGCGQLIMLVEDDLASATLLTGYLKRCGYQITRAESAEEALARVREQVPALVITDVRMRGMDGLDLIRHLRGAVATRATPIIALTALAMPGDHERCIEAGASAYLSKPLPLRRLAATVADLLA